MMLRYQKAPQEKRRCKNCGCEFLIKKKIQRFCSAICRVAHWRKWHPTIDPDHYEAIRPFLENPERIDWGRVRRETARLLMYTDKIIKAGAPVYKWAILPLDPLLLSLSQYTGVYIIFSIDHRVLYVGASSRVGGRVLAHLKSPGRPIDSVKVKRMSTFTEAEILEARLILRLRPLENRDRPGKERIKYIGYGQEKRKEVINVLGVLPNAGSEKAGAAVDSRPSTKKRDGKEG